MKKLFLAASLFLVSIAPYADTPSIRPPENNDVTSPEACAAYVTLMSNALQSSSNENDKCNANWYSELRYATPPSESGSIMKNGKTIYYLGAHPVNGDTTLIASTKLCGAAAISNELIKSKILQMLTLAYSDTNTHQMIMNNDNVQTYLGVYGLISVCTYRTLNQCTPIVRQVPVPL